jgi:glycosyltransferase involved in cell wall biosynthesis
MGLASTRNVGLQRVQGKYIMFVDSDDCVNADVIRRFLDYAIKKELDILYFDVEEFGELVSEKMKVQRKRNHKYKIEDGISVFDSMVKNGEMFGSVWGAIYRREFLLDIRLKFIDGILHEDIPFTFEALSRADRVAVINEVGYFYRQRGGSILHQPNYIKRAQGLIIGYSKLLNIWYDSIQSEKGNKAEESVDVYLSSVISMVRSNLLKVDEGDYTKYPIVKHFVQNLKINKYRNYYRIFDADTIKNLQEYNHIALYGAGRIAEELMGFLSQEEVKVDIVFVTNKNDNKDKIGSVEIIQYSKDVGDLYDAIIIAVATETQESILQYLQKLDYSGKILMYSL